MQRTLLRQRFATHILRGHRSSFSTSSVLLKKGSKKASPAADSPANDSEQAPLDLAALKTKFQSTVEQFNARAHQVKLGRTNLEAIQKLQVETDHKQHVPLSSLCNVQLKNNKILVFTVFDPKSIKYIKTALLEHFEITPEDDKKNPLAINITLPPQTSEVKKGLVKQLKAEYDHFRQSASKHSLAKIREDVMKSLKKDASASDNQKKKDLAAAEKLFKTSSDELLAAFKKQEASLK